MLKSFIHTSNNTKSAPIKICYRSVFCFGPGLIGFGSDNDSHRGWYNGRKTYYNISWELFAPSFSQVFGTSCLPGAYQDILPGLWSVFSFHFLRLFEVKEENEPTRKIWKNTQQIKTLTFTIFKFAFSCNIYSAHRRDSPMQSPGAAARDVSPVPSGGSNTATNTTSFSPTIKGGHSLQLLVKF